MKLNSSITFFPLHQSTSSPSRSKSSGWCVYGCAWPEKNHTIPWLAAWIVGFFQSEVLLPPHKTNIWKMMFARQQVSATPLKSSENSHFPLKNAGWKMKLSFSVSKWSLFPWHSWIFGVGGGTCNVGISMEYLGHIPLSTMNSPVPKNSWVWPTNPKSYNYSFTLPPKGQESPTSEFFVQNYEEMEVKLGIIYKVSSKLSSFSIKLPIKRSHASFWPVISP